MKTREEIVIRNVDKDLGEKRLKKMGWRKAFLSSITTSYFFSISFFFLFFFFLFTDSFFPFEIATIHKCLKNSEFKHIRNGKFRSEERECDENKNKGIVFTMNATI